MAANRAVVRHSELCWSRWPRDGRIDSARHLCRSRAMLSLRRQIVGTAALLVGGLGVLIVSKPGAGDWPAWVQAIGSVAAIVAAIFIAQWQAGRERGERLEDRREFRGAVAGLGRRLAGAIAKQAASMIENPAYHAFEGGDAGEFLLLDAALDRFDPSALVSAEGVLALEGLRREGKLFGHFERMIGEEYRGEDHFDFDVKDAVRKWRDRADQHATMLEHLAKQRH